MTRASASDTAGLGPTRSRLALNVCVSCTSTSSALAARWTVVPVTMDRGGLFASPAEAVRLDELIMGTLLMSGTGANLVRAGAWRYPEGAGRGVGEIP